MIEPTVFIVDDERAVRESLSALLSAHQMPVQLFSSAEEFLSFYDGARPGCLVTDIRLDGGLSGLQLQQMLVERGRTLPVIMISGHPDEQARQDALAKGALSVLEKPVPHRVLLSHLRRALEIAAQEGS